MQTALCNYRVLIQPVCAVIPMQYVKNRRQMSVPLILYVTNHSELIADADK